MGSVCLCFRKPPLLTRSYFKTRPDVSLEMAPIGDDRYSAFSKWSPSNALILFWMRAGLLYNPLYSPTPTPANTVGGRECISSKSAQHGGCDELEKEMINTLLTLFSQTIRTSQVQSSYTWLNKLLKKDKNHTSAITIIQKSICPLKKACLGLWAYVTIIKC